MSEYHQNISVESEEVLDPGRITQRYPPTAYDGKVTLNNEASSSVQCQNRIMEEEQLSSKQDNNKGACQATSGYHHPRSSKAFLPLHDNRIGPFSMRINSSLDPKVIVELQDRDLWTKFAKLQTEMIVTKPGRRLFPSLGIKITGMDDTANYCVIMDMVNTDDNRFKYQNGKWTVVGRGEPPIQGKYFVHPTSPACGKDWMRDVVTFKIKLTNSCVEEGGEKILVHSMHRYQPRFHIIRSDDITKLIGNDVSSFSFPETAFITVTAYQNSDMTRMKVYNNPFARGFRSNGGKTRNAKLLSAEIHQAGRMFHPYGHRSRWNDDCFLVQHRQSSHLNSPNRAMSLSAPSLLFASQRYDESSPVPNVGYYSSNQLQRQPILSAPRSGPPSQGSVYGASSLSSHCLEPSTTVASHQNISNSESTVMQQFKEEAPLPNPSLHHFIPTQQAATEEQARFLRVPSQHYQQPCMVESPQHVESYHNPTQIGRNFPVMLPPPGAQSGLPQNVGGQQDFTAVGSENSTALLRNSSFWLADTSSNGVSACEYDVAPGQMSSQASNINAEYPSYREQSF